MHGGIGGGWTMRILSNGDGMTMSGLWKISETKGIYIKKNNTYYTYFIDWIVCSHIAQWLRKSRLSAGNLSLTNYGEFFGGRRKENLN